MKAKVIIWNGIIDSVLVDQEAADVEIEVVEFDDNYANSHKVEKYVDELKQDPSLFESEHYIKVMSSDNEGDPVAPKY